LRHGAKLRSKVEAAGLSRSITEALSPFIVSAKAKQRSQKFKNKINTKNIANSISTFKSRDKLYRQSPKLAQGSPEDATRSLVSVEKQRIRARQSLRA
jgi:hypothetical protein